MNLKSDQHLILQHNLLQKCKMLLQMSWKTMWTINLLLAHIFQYYWMKVVTYQLQRNCWYMLRPYPLTLTLRPTFLITFRFLMELPRQFINLLKMPFISLSKVLAVGSDGASVMTGGKNGFVALLKKQDSPYVIGIHCVAHSPYLH